MIVAFLAAMLFCFGFGCIAVAVCMIALIREQYHELRYRLEHQPQVIGIDMGHPEGDKTSIDIVRVLVQAVD